MADHSGALGAHFHPQNSSRSKLAQVSWGVLKLPLTAVKKVKHAAVSGVESALDITGKLGDAYRHAEAKAAAKEAAAKEAAAKAAAAKEAAKEAAAKAAAAAEQYFEYTPSKREAVMSRARIREAKEREAAMSTINGGGSNKKPLKKLVKKPVVKPAKKKVATTRARK